MKSLFFFLILFSTTGFAAAPTDEEILSLARREVATKLNRIKSWMVQSGQLQSDLTQCDSKSNSFDPAFEMPDKNSKTFTDLCDLLPVPKNQISQDVLSAPHQGNSFETVLKCEFIMFTPCAIEFRKHIKHEVGQSPPPRAWVFNFVVERDDLIAETILQTIQMNPSPTTVGNVGDALVRCEPVAAMGVLPTWICEVGTFDQWYADGKLLNGIEPWPEYAQDYKNPALPKMFYHILFEAK
jgi:hypothetical protein